MSFRLGLTGSIGMGKSTTAQMFAALGCAVWSADDAVHRLYEPGGAAVIPMTVAFPEAIDDGGVSRDALKAIIGEDPSALKRIEAIVHPLVQQDRETFASTDTQDIVVFDVPLLFETGVDTEMDAVVVVSTNPGSQRARVLSRGTMSEQQFETILAKQMPDAEKRKRADYVVKTDTLDDARAQVSDIVAAIRRGLADA